jgi:hypothetical protein
MDKLSLKAWFDNLSYYIICSGLFWLGIKTIIRGKSLFANVSGSTLIITSAILFLFNLFQSIEILAEHLRGIQISTIEKFITFVAKWATYIAALIVVFILFIIASSIYFTFAKP